MSWWSELVCETYPPVKIFESKRNITISELRRFVRIILTEGIPFAFAQLPLAYEFARQRAAERIGVDPKQISMTGSARLGYSLSPHKFGKAYDPSASDVDLFLIDETRFAALAQEFADFVALFESAKIFTLATSTSAPTGKRISESSLQPLGEVSSIKSMCPPGIRFPWLNVWAMPNLSSRPTSTAR